MDRIVAVDMGKGRDEDVACAREFFELAERGASHEELIRPLRKIKEHLEGTIRHAHSRWKGRASYPLEDLTHEVYIKLLKKPPRWDRKSNPMAKLLSWINTVAVHELRDEYRKSKRREFAESQWRERGGSPEGLPPSRSVEPVMFFEEFVQWMERAGGRTSVIRFARTYFDNKACDDRELAEMLNTSPQNIHKLRSRMRAQAREYSELVKGEMSAREDRAVQADEVPD